MTRIELKKERGIYKLSAVGHAGYDNSGRDIVCAAISVLIFSLASRLEELDREGGLKKGAKLSLGAGRAEIAFRARRKSRAQAEGALGMLRCGMRMLAEDYPENVKFMEF